MSPDPIKSRMKAVFNLHRAWRLVWRAAQETLRITGDVLGTIFFFTKWGDEKTTTTDTNITIDTGTDSVSQ